MTTQAEKDALVARLTKIQSVGGSLLSNATALKTLAAGLVVETDPTPAPPPDPTPPAPTPPVGTRFGFGLAQSTAYTDGLTGISEQPADSRARLVSTFGDFDVAKVFYNGTKQPTTFDPAFEGQVPVAMVCWSPDAGSLTTGKLDAQIKAYCASVPAGHTVMLAPWNEADNGGSTITLAALKTARDHLYDVVTTSPTGGGTVEVWDCWMGFSVHGDGSWSDSWTTPAKRHGIGFDTYWNKSTVSKDPHTNLDKLAAVAKRLGLPWAIPETGDNRPGTGNEVGTAYDDAARAKAWTARYQAMRDLGVAWVSYFDQQGTTGDHRLIPGKDDLTIAALKTFL